LHCIPLPFALFNLRSKPANSRASGNIDPLSVAMALVRSIRFKYFKSASGP